MKTLPRCFPEIPMEGGVLPFAQEGTDPTSPMYYEERTFEALRLTEAAFIGLEVSDCEFKNCTFEKPVLTDCVFRSCRFTGCRIVAPRTERTELKHCEFERCQLAGVYWKDVTPYGGVAAPFDSLKACCLKYCSFMEMRLNRSDFCGNELIECMFEGCKLGEAKFGGCDLTRTAFAGCDLRKADFRGAHGYQIQLRSNLLKAARFSLPEALRLLEELEIRIDG